MTFEIGLLLAIVVTAGVLFSLERWSPDVVALGVMLALVLTGLLPAARAFAGFGSDTVMLILGVLILTTALQRTGAVDVLGRFILRHAGDSPRRLLLLVMVACSGASAFMSNTAATALFVPVVFAVAKRASIAASKLLLPLAFASILSSSVSLISTSTNIVISGLLPLYDQAPLTMFELSPVGVPIAIVGVAYLWLFGHRLLPDRGVGDTLTQFGLREYLTEIVLLPTSPLVGKPLADAQFAAQLGLRVLRVARGTRVLSPADDLELQVHDVLLVEGNSEDILKIKDIAGIEIRPDLQYAAPDESSPSTLVEAILLPGSWLIGRTLKSAGLFERHELTVLAMNRHGGTILRKLSQIALRMGDVLLVQGDKDRIADLERGRMFRVLGEVDGERLPAGRRTLAVAIFALSILLPSFGLLALPVSALLGAFLVFLTGCISPEEAYRDIEWKAVILIGSILALGTAMTATGTDRWLAAQIVATVGQLGPVPLLAGFFWLTVLLTQPMSNQAAAVVVLPAAIQTALQLELNPRTFAIMVAVAASCSYLTPLEPSCLMVYGPGRYRFSDFLRVGAPLTVIIFGIALLLVPMVWPLRL